MKNAHCFIENDHRLTVRLLVFGLLILGLMQGCSSGSESTTKVPVQNATVAAGGDSAHRFAIQHFIDGAVYDAKGEYAQAVLEYQDALRFEKNFGIFFALSHCYSLLGKHSLAIEAGKEAVRLAPDNLECRRSLADACAAAFDIDGATEQYEEIVKRDSTDLNSWYSLARVYQARKPLRALEVYDHILGRFGPQWDVLIQSAEMYNKMGQFEKAAEMLKKMLSLDSGNQPLRRTVAQTLVRAAKYEEALALLNELRELDSDNLDYRADIAGIYLLQREYQKAAREFEVILSRDTVSIETKLHIGELYFGQLEKDSSFATETRAIFAQIRTSHPQDWRAYWFLGAVGTIIHDDTLAVGNFTKVTELASWNADAWVYLSSVFLGKNNFAEVTRVLESALKILPDDFRVNFFLGVAYSRLGRNIDAVRVLEHARQLNPKDVEAIAQLALVYDGLRKYEESDSLYEEALKLNPANDLVLNNYAYSLADRGIELDRSLEMAKKAIESQPENPSYLDTIGWVYYRLGGYRDAETYVKKAISKGEANAVVYEHLGDIYFKLAQKEKALEQWHAALKLDQNNTALREKIARGEL